MTLVPSLAAFTAAAALLTITPGVDTAMVLRTAAAGGPRRGALAAAGIILGCLVWGAAVALGLGALITASRTAFTLLKWIGAAYLAWLGIGLLLRPRAHFAMGPAQPAGAPLRRGFLTNMLNPKVGAFYVTFLPQFVPAGVNPSAFMFGLAVIHGLLGLIWFTALIAAVTPLSRWLARPAVMKTLDRVTGCVFLAFGARLALADRPLRVKLPLDPETIKGFLDPAEGATLYDAAVAQAPLGPCLEIGSWCGKSAVYIGAACQAAGGLLFSVDHHRGSEENQPGWEWFDESLWDEAAGSLDTLPAFRRTLRAAKLEETVIPVVGRSALVAHAWRTPLAFLFIDGGHTMEAAMGDYRGWTPHLIAGGLLAIHDVFPDLADGGRPPFEIYRLACASGLFEPVAAVKSLRLLRRL